MATKFRKGDIVSVQGTVKHDFEEDEDAHISIELANAISASVWVKPDSVTVIRQKIVVGDAVWTDVLGSELPGKLIFIHAGSAWIDVDGVMYTHSLESLKRAES